MKYKISEISRMTGFSVSGVRFFEKAGLISPLRGENGKYRDFSMNEIQLLLMCKSYRDCGFSLQESVELTNHADAQQVKTFIECRSNKLDQEINEKQTLVEMLREKVKHIDDFQECENCCQIVHVPAMLRIKLWQPGSMEGEFVPFQLVHEWMNRIPFTESCLKLSEQNLLHGKGELETDWGIAIEENIANRINFSPKSKVEYIPARECVRTVVKVSKDLTMHSDQLKNVREYLANNNLESKGPAISRLFFNSNRNGLFIRQDFLWVPINRH